MHTPRKRFGQNFLVDKNIIFKIINSINPKPTETILEIGPGLGALTIPLLELCKTLYAVELDRDVIPILKEATAKVGNLILYEGDVLNFKFEELFSEPKKIRCVGNLPYNISSPLIFHLLKQRQWIFDMHFMLQKEMVQRICATSGTKEYGRISVMVQYYCKTEALFIIKPMAFNPAPKVDSAIIRLTPYETLPIKANDEIKFANLVRDAFNQRRKTISNSLKGIVSVDQLISLGIDPKIRPEQLSVAEFVKMANL